MIEAIFCLEAFIIAFSVTGLLMLLSKCLNSWYPDWEKNAIIKKLQPLFPFVLSIAGAFIYPPAVAVTFAQILVWSFIPAMISMSGYKIFKAMLFEKTGVEVDDLIEKKHEISDKQEKIDEKQNKVDVETKEVDKLIEKKLIENDPKSK
jgi:hypothetical protein